ncbi:MAG: hypothetical protein WBM69_11540 [Desulfobacterales bacterium]
MTKIDCKEIAYNGSPIDSLTRDEMISAFEELAGAIHDCAEKGKKCEALLQIKKSIECKDK